MSTPLIVRYFYTPICPENFATLDKLQRLFGNDKIFCFEVFNLAQDELQSEYSWFPAEEEILREREENGNRPLLYGTLFFAGKVVPGFPPSPKHLQQSFEENGLTWDPENYSFCYRGQVEREDWKCDRENFVLRKYDVDNLYSVSRLCTHHHPYLSPDSFDENYWQPYEDKKSNFLKKSLSKGEVLGFLAYYQDELAGFIEAFPVSLARKMGFCISNFSSTGLMITCLSVRQEATGYGLASQLVKALEKESSERGYKSIEVLAFPDGHNWQPVSFYTNLGYKEVRSLDSFKILEKSLND